MYFFWWRSSNIDWCNMLMVWICNGPLGGLICNDLSSFLYVVALLEIWIWMAFSAEYELPFWWFEYDVPLGGLIMEWPSWWFLNINAPFGILICNGPLDILIWNGPLGGLNMNEPVGILKMNDRPSWQFEYDGCNTQHFQNV